MDSVFGSPIVPVTFAFSVLAIAACFEFKTIQIPNKLTLGAAAAALLFAITKTILAPTAPGGIIQATCGMILGGAILLPLYAKYGLGAGCVKTHAAFGAWLGCGFGFATFTPMLIVGSICAALSLVVYSWIKRRQGNTWTLAQPALSIGTVLGVIATNWI